LTSKRLARWIEGIITLFYMDKDTLMVVHDRLLEVYERYEKYGGDSEFLAGVSECMHVIVRMIERE
jgi:hypothetical protein